MGISSSLHDKSDVFCGAHCAVAQCLNTQDLCFCERTGDCQIHSCLFDRSRRLALAAE